MAACNGSERLCCADSNRLPCDRAMATRKEVMTKAVQIQPDIEVNSTSNGDQQSAKFTNNPGGGNGSGGTCFGDSGGPLFHGDSNVVGAVVSWGITPCIGVDYQFRVDTPTALDFLSQFLE